MNKAYANGELQNTEEGNKTIANFTDLAKGMGIAVVSVITAKEAAVEFKKANANRTTKIVELEAHPGAMATKKELNAHDAAGVGMLLAVGVVVCSNSDNLKRAFAYGAQKSKQFGSFLGATVDAMQKYTQDHVAEDLNNPEKPTFFNKFNKVFGRSGR